MKEAALLSPVLEESLPFIIKQGVYELYSAGRFGACELSEIRLRLGRPSSLSVGGRNIKLDSVLGVDELTECLMRLCRGSVYAHDRTIRNGYISVEGGIRVGVCGTFSGEERGIRQITSLNIRIPHIIRGVCQGILERSLCGGNIRSLLIYSPPGEGKTTLLRDIAAVMSDKYQKRVCLLDTRGELYIEEMFSNCLCDVLIGYPRAVGIEIATRTLSPELIICDELGDEAEARQILSAQNTGVPIIASAHASSIDGLLSRPNIALLHENRVFSGYVGIRREMISGKLSRQFDFDYTPREQEREINACFHS